MNVLIGTILKHLTRGLSLILDILIGLIALSVNIVSIIKHGFLALLSLGGCLLILLLAGPYTFYILFHPTTMLVILFFIVFPILGTKFVSFLHYVKYMFTEYLFDLSDYLISGSNMAYRSFSDYGRQYKEAEEARKRREQQERQQQRQRAWEEQFRQWQKYQRSQQQGGYGYYQNSYQRDPTSDFKKKYEESCDILGIDYNADKYQVKLAYRKMAKKYHPDVNKSPDAGEQFKRINSAYEFLNDTNIEHYRQLHQNAI